MPQRWSPRGRPWHRGHILKSLASKPQVLKNCPVLFFELFFELILNFWTVEIIFWTRWNFAGKRQKPRGKFAKTFFGFLNWRSPEKIFWKPFFFGDCLKNFYSEIFFWRTLAPMSLVLGLAPSIPVLGLEMVCPRKGCPWPWPRIFGLGPWPRALCPWLHLCCAVLSSTVRWLKGYWQPSSKKFVKIYCFNYISLLLKWRMV